MMLPNGPPRTQAMTALALTTLALALAGCKQPAAPANTSSNDKRPDREWTDAARVEAIASTLQACSYDGSPTRVEPGQLHGQAPADCRSMVDDIMGYTGLPANFMVTAGPVPNAVAVILLDQQQVPQRVIAFNPDFIGATERLTGGGKWGPISIMAHEIGHHLSGHTITAGGSRPEIELEADKFSGFVLYKMGATLHDATKAMDTLGSPTEQPTHPAKTRRVAAITQGWQEACRQAGATTCASGAAPTTPVSGPPVQTTTVTLPTPGPQSIPFKGGRFVVDETGLLEPAEAQRLDQELFALARDHGVEIALLVVKDLHGMDANAYAWAMMRQLRVGKLDVGNGAVLVVAPEQGQAAAALGPGIARERENADDSRSLSRWITDAWPICKRYNGCRAWTGNLAGSVRFIAKSVEPLEWTIRYQSMKDFMDVYNANFEANMKKPANRTYDPQQEVAYKRIVRFRGKVIDLNTPVGIPVIKPEVMSNAAIVKRGYLPVHVQSEDGFPVVFYVDPKIQRVLPAGDIQAGKEYTFVGRVQAPSPIKGQATHMWALSYDPI